MPPRFFPRDLVSPPEALWNDELDGVWAEPQSSEEAEQLLVALDHPDVVYAPNTTDDLAPERILGVLRSHSVRGESPAWGRAPSLQTGETRGK